MFAVCGAVTKASRESIHSVNIRHSAANALNLDQTWLLAVATLVHRTTPGSTTVPFSPPFSPNRPRIEIKPTFINNNKCSTKFSVGSCSVRVFIRMFYGILLLFFQHSALECVSKWSSVLSQGESLLQKANTERSFSHPDKTKNYSASIIVPDISNTSVRTVDGVFMP